MLQPPESITPTDLTADPAIVALAPSISRIRAFAKDLVIRSKEGYEKAVAILRDNKQQQETVEAQRVKITKPLNEALRAVNAQAKLTIAPLQEDERAIKAAMRVYLDEQERARREAQRKLDEQAAAQRKRLQEAAARNEAKGNEARADSFRERAEAVVAPVVQSHAPKVDGVSTRKVWQFEVTDKSQIKDEWKKCDEVAIRKTVNALGDAAPGVVGAGLRVWSETQIAASAS